jgi:hypothetical protein
MSLESSRAFDFRRGQNMPYKFVSLILVAVLVHSSVAAQSMRQSPAQPEKIQQILRKAQDNDKAVKVTLARNIGGRTKLEGKVSEISGSGFTLIEQKTGKITTLTYADVLQVKQSGMSKGARIGIGVGIVVGALILVAILVTKPWRSE